ncbi:hypothetical protein [Luteimonas lutimaris]|uniref:Uncharacterized protein n=1 Tax=Luteimonas lutimaris TaxID=698645 RepID=A0ABP7M1S2_9GAMM
MSLPDDHSEAATPRRPILGRFDDRRIELLIGFCVVLISVISLFVAASANRTQERLLAASVWPNLQFATGNADRDGNAAITFDLISRGVGPARVRWAEISYDGHVVADSAELLERCCAREIQASGQRTRTSTSGIQPRVVGADEWISFFRMGREDNAEPVWKALERGLPRLAMRACYCSVLDDCWMLDSREAEPAPIARCPASGDSAWGR